MKSHAPSNKQLGDFLRASVSPAQGHRDGTLDDARTILKAHPEIGDSDIYTACVLGRDRRWKELLRRNRTLAVAPGGALGWRPLSYVCFSRFFRLGNGLTRKRFVRSAKLLLDAGADPNTSFINAGDNEPEFALYGACGVANDPAMTKLLLDDGADPNDNESLYHVAEFRDLRCLRLLLGVKSKRKWISYCMCHKMDMEDPAGVRLFIAHGGDPNFLIDRGLFKGYRPLHFALFRRRSAAVVRLLLRAGADPNRADANGMTSYQLARRLGNTTIARLLLKHRATDDLDERTRYIAALPAGDARTAGRMMRDDPSLAKTILSTDHHLLVDIANAGNVRAVRLMLDAGFPIETKGCSFGGWDGTALAQAASMGRVGAVKLLLERGADPTLKHCFGGDALGAAIHGAAHGWHHNGAKTVGMIALAIRGKNLDGYIAYARSTRNRSVIAALDRVMASSHAVRTIRSSG